MEYDPAGAAAANADIEKLKQAAAEVPSPGTAPAATPPEGGSPPAAPAADAGLAETRAEVAEATEAAAAAEEELADARSEAAEATAEATAAETKQSAAQEKAQAAAKKEAEEEAKLRREMQLAAKSRQELIRELERLAKARRAAAEAGNAEEFAALTAQMGETRSAFEKMNQGMELNNIQMQQQAQMGMQAAQTIGELGKAARGGSMDLAGMAGQVMAVGAAIKAGLGPVGWMMLALQGLQTAFELWQGNKTEELNRQLEENKKHFEEMEAAWQRANELARAERNAEQTEAARATREAMEAAQVAGEAAAREAERTLAAEEEYARHEFATWKMWQEEAKLKLEAAVAAGEIDAEFAAERKAAIDRETAQREAAVQQESELRRAAAARDAAARAQAEADAMAEAMQQMERYKPLMQVELASESELARLERRLEELDEVDDAAEYAATERRRNEILQQHNEVRRLMEELGIATGNSAAERYEFVRKIQEEYRAQEKTVEAARRNAAAAAEQAEATATAAEHRAKEAEVAGQLRELAEAQRAAAQQVAHSLEAMEEELRVTGSYTAKDSRTQAQIHAADAAALTERRRRLTALRDTPNMDAATLRQINTKIRETDDQLHGLHDAMHQSAVEAQRVVAGLQPLGQQAKNRGAQGALKRAERAYQRLAQRAERQASRGDTQALERTQDAMRRNALQQEKLTGYTGRAAARQREVEGHLQALAQGTADQDRGLTAQQRVENAIRQQLEGRRRHSARAAQAERRAAAAAENNAKAAERRNPRAQAQQVAGLTQQLTTATTALNEMRAEVGRLDGAIAQLATVAGQAAQAAASGAQVAAGKLAGLQNQVNGLKNAITQLRRA